MGVLLEASGMYTCVCAGGYHFREVCGETMALCNSTNSQGQSRTGEADDGAPIPEASDLDDSPSV
jgi:hypothetical protein